jgi:hypothetical protein
MIADLLAFLGLGSKVERGERNSMVKLGGATGCRGTRTDFPSARRSGDRHLLARGGSVSFCAISTPKGCVLNYRIYSTIRMSLQPMIESFQRASRSLLL